MASIIKKYPFNFGLLLIGLLSVSSCTCDSGEAKPTMKSYVIRNSNEFLDEFYRIQIFLSQHELPESLDHISTRISEIIRIVDESTSIKKETHSIEEVFVVFQSLNEVLPNDKLDFDKDIALPDLESFTDDEFNFVVKLMGYKVWVRLLEPIDTGSVVK